MYDEVQHLIMFYQFLPRNCIIQVQESTLCAPLYYAARLILILCLVKKCGPFGPVESFIILVSVPYWLPLLYQPSVH